MGKFQNGLSAGTHLTGHAGLQEILGHGLGGGGIYLGCRHIHKEQCKDSQ